MTARQIAAADLVTALGGAGLSGYVVASNGSGPQWNAISAILDAALGNTRGAILYRGASGWAVRLPGTSGQVLQSAGAGNDPIWAPAAGGSSTVPNTTVAASGSAVTLSFPSNGSASFDVTLTANCTFTVIGGTNGQMQQITLVLRQDATAGRVPTLPSTIKWTSGSPPAWNTVAGRVDIVTLTTTDAGTTVFGSY